MLDRTQAPPFHKISSFKVNEPDLILVDDHIPIYLFPSEIPQVLKIEFIFSGGKWLESKQGASFFTLKMLAEGTTSYSSKEIATIFDENGASFKSASYLDYSEITIYCLNTHLSELIPVLNELLFKPTFPQKQLEKLKMIRLEQLKTENQKNNLVASKAFREKLYGETHPYGSQMTEKTIKEIQTEDLKTYHQSLLKSDGVMIVSGNISNSVINQLKDFSRKFKPMGNTKQNYPVAPLPPSSTEIPMHRSVQVSIRVGKPVVKKNHPDYKKLKITNELLGGFFGSRLMKNIREEKGLTYGIYSQIVSLKRSSFFVIGTDVNKGSELLAVSEIFNEINLLRHSLTDDNELETVKNYMIGSLQSEINTPFDLAEKFKSTYLFGLDNSYHSELFETINKITADEIRELAALYFDPESMTKLTVG